MENKENIQFETETGESSFSSLLRSRSQWKEKLIRWFFAAHGLLVVLAIVMIALFLFREVIIAFIEIGPDAFFFSAAEDGSLTSAWNPSGSDPGFSLLPLLTGTFLTALPALFISTIFGIAIGIYISEILRPGIRTALKPVIEVFAGIPTVVIGFFMLSVGATFFDGLFSPVNRLNAFVAAVGLSVVVVPVIASLTEEALQAIPRSTREAAYSLGATRWQTIRRVLLPAAANGVSTGILLGFSRAIGETMIVLMASGNAANITAELFRSVRTMTAAIAAEMGEVSQGSLHYYSLFVVGFVLFLITFLLNFTASRLMRRSEAKKQAMK